MKHTRIYTFLLLMGMTAVASAQEVSPVDFMRTNPRAAYSNVATFTPYFGFFDMALGDVNVQVQNIGFKYDKFMRFNEQGYPVALDLAQGAASMKNTNFLNVNASADVFSCGRRTRYGFFTYNHRFRVQESMAYSGDIIRLAANGNGAFLDHPANLDVKMNAKAYQEFNFGYQMCLTPKLNVGARVKFLMGAAHVHTNSLNAQLSTDPSTFALSVTENVDVRATLPYEVSFINGKLNIADKRFNIMNYLKNYGTGIDLGAEYYINERFGVAAAINDFGFIHWNNNTVHFTGSVNDVGSMYESGAFVFDGINSAELQNLINDEDYLDKYLDTLTQYFGLQSENLKGYNTMLNTTLLVRGYYNIDAQNRLSAQLQGYCSGIGFRPALTLAYNGSFNDLFDVVATYTMMPQSYGNIGLGLSANLGGFQIFVASNNVLGFFNPANTRTLNAQIGISFTSPEQYKRHEVLVKE